jgi:PAS domain S-box-containing protein
MMHEHLQNKKIMLIDPDSNIGHFFENAIRGTGMYITQFSSGKKALDAISKIKPDFIFSEFHTLDLSGRDIFISLLENKSLTEYSTIPFVIFSDDFYRSKYSQELFELGLRGWFSKPFGSHEIIEVIDNFFHLHEILQKNIELQREVRKSEYMYRDLLENAYDFIFTLDHKGKFVYLNNRFQSLTGYEKEKWMEKKFVEIINKDDRKNVKSHYTMILNGKARIFEARILNNSSNSLILSFSITPIFDRGKIVGSMGIGRDVTEQKQLEKEILTLKNFNESIIQSMEAGLLTIDLDQNITSLNAGGEKILEWKEKEVIKKKIDSILTQEEIILLLSDPPNSRGYNYSRETELTVKSGKKIYIGFTKTDRIDNQGKKLGTIISFRDITQLKQMQTEVIRMDRLASLGVLASGIAHEIKNPLAGIKTMAQACEEEFSNEDPKKEYLIRITRQVNRLDDLLKTFFAYARPKRPDRKHHFLPEILNEVTNLVSKKMSYNNISYVEELPSNLPAIFVDYQQMQQIFLNLIINSIDAMPNGGKLIISAQKVNKPTIGLIRKESKIKQKNNNSFIEVRVADTGKGISEGQLHTIFDPFFTTKPTGLGLGLSIVYRIIKENYGDIHVESEVEKRTVFIITLPTGENE